MLHIASSDKGRGCFGYLYIYMYVAAVPLCVEVFRVLYSISKSISVDIMGSLTLAACLIVFLSLAQFGSSSTPHHPCHSKFSSFPFCNTSLPTQDRVKDLVGRLTLHEKVMQLVNTAEGVSRLGIPKYEWWSEALHGVSNTGPGTQFGGRVPGAVSFPQVILTAATFNTSLWRTIGEVISTEARAMYNVGQSGLTFWSPNINIYRDPRWGRGHETPGEDPLVVSKYAVNFVKGLQDVEEGDRHSLMKVAACCKHFSAYDLDNWTRYDRYHFDAKVTQQDLQDTYQPPFQTCVEEGNVACVMCSYNRINGVPACADKDLLLGVLRKQWGLNGYIASDCDSVEVMYKDVHYTKSPEEAVADSIRAGLNMNCGTYLSNYTEKAVKSGLLNETTVDESLSYLYTSLMRLGYFNGHPRKQKYGSLGPKDVCTEEHRDVALEAAKQGIVLLKNIKNALPLSKQKVRKVAVIGPNANKAETMIGNYAGIPCRYTTPLQGIEKYTKTLYQPGCPFVACNSTGLNIKAAVEVASRADAVILVMGLDLTEERESYDRTSLLLPGEQEKLITEVAKAAKGPVVLVLMSGGPVDITFAKENANISSILWAGYPGEAGGDAIAEVIFGDYNPGGKLPNTWYPESYTNIPMTNMQMRANSKTGYPGRTYRFYRGKTVYKFGYGLSYTNYSMSISGPPNDIVVRMKTNKSSISSSSSNRQSMVNVEDVDCKGMQFSARVEVKNEGEKDGSQAVLVFWEPPSPNSSFSSSSDSSNSDIPLGAPMMQLVAFDRVFVRSGETKDVIFSMNACNHLSSVDEGGHKVLALGTHGLVVGVEEDGGAAGEEAASVSASRARHSISLIHS